MSSFPAAPYDHAGVSGKTNDSPASVAAAAAAVGGREVEVGLIKAVGLRSPADES